MTIIRKSGARKLSAVLIALTSEIHRLGVYAWLVGYSGRRVTSAVLLPRNRLTTDSGRFEASTYVPNACVRQSPKGIFAGRSNGGHRLEAGLVCC